MKDKIITSLLWTCIVSIFSGVLVFVYETFFGFPAYLDSRAESGWEGLGLIGIILLGAIAGACLIFFGVLCLIATVGLKKSETPSAVKGWAIFGIITQFLLAGGLIAYAIIMLTVYNGGYVGKVLYFCLSIIPIALAIVNIVLCAKPKSRAQERQESPEQETA